MKKTLCLLLSAIMLMSALPFVALGASKLNLVDLKGIVPPSENASPDWNITANDSDYEVVNVVWFDHESGTDMKPGDKFVAGNSYRLNIYVVTNNGFEFRTDGVSGKPVVSVTHNSDQLDNYCIFGNESQLQVQIDYDPVVHTESNVINEIEITVDQPIAAVAPSFTKIDTPQYYSDGNVSPETKGIKWYDVTDGKHLINGTGAKFTCDHIYRVSFSLSTKGDYEFGNALAKVNGKTAELTWHNPYTVTVTYTFDKLVCLPEFVEGEFPACNDTGHVGYFACACGKWYWNKEGTNPVENKDDILIPPTGAHTETTVTCTKATLTSDGKIETKCSVCGEVTETQTIAKIGSLSLSATKYIHDGKNKTPKLTVKDANGKTLIKNTDYKVSVASNKSSIGRYTVKVTFMGNYEGTKNLFFYILPGKPSTVKADSQTTSTAKLSWSAVSGAAGYTLYYYSNSKKAYVKINTTTNTTYTVKGLLTGTKYTFKIVAYGKTAAGKVYDSESYTLIKTATKTKTPELTKVTASSTKGKAYVYHTDVKGETGYTVYYSTSKTSGFKKYANFKADTTRCDITALTSGKTYYFKVRTYIKTDSGYVYSAWSAVKGIKVK